MVALTTGSIIYSFTSSNHPSSGQLADISIYLNNTMTTTASLSFPSAWKNIGTGWPTSITASKVAIISLRAYDTNTVVGSYNVQL